MVRSSSFSEVGVSKVPVQQLLSQAEAHAAAEAAALALALAAAENSFPQAAAPTAVLQSRERAIGTPACPLPAQFSQCLCPSERTPR